jgi:hypothetical protein
MAAKHLIVAAFAGGCLSGAGLIALSQNDGTVVRDAEAARGADRDRAPTPAIAADEEDDSKLADEARRNAGDERDGHPRTAELDARHATDAGSSVADVLNRLEAAYREGIAATPAPAPPAALPKSPAPTLSPRSEPATVAATAPASAPVTATLPANTPAVPAAATTAPMAAAARAPEASEARRLAAREDAAPRDVYVGDVQQNTNVASVQQGDVYVIQHVIPYVPYLALPPANPGAPPTYGPRPVTPRSPLPSVHFRYPPAYPNSPFKYPVDLVH